jgi:hypothetical protein
VGEGEGCHHKRPIGPPVRSSTIVMISCATRSFIGKLGAATQGSNEGKGPVGLRCGMFSGWGEQQQ